MLECGRIHRCVALIYCREEIGSTCELTVISLKIQLMGIFYYTGLTTNYNKRFQTPIGDTNNERSRPSF